MLRAALCCIQRESGHGLQVGALICRPSAGSLIAMQLCNVPKHWVLLHLLLLWALVW